MELPINPLICSRFLMRVYAENLDKVGMRIHGIHFTLEEIGKHDNQVGFALEQRAGIPSLYGYRQHVRDYHG